MIILGEGLNVVSAPIIQSPLGLGILHTGLGFIFSARAFENDPTQKMSLHTLGNHRGVFAKAGYVLRHMGQTVRQVANSNGLLLKRFGQLFSAKRQQAAQFFRQEIFNKTPSIVGFTEHLNAAGKSFWLPRMKSSPYLLHFSTFLLALGGITLTLGSLLHQKQAQRVGFWGCASGGTLDCIGMSRLGLEKMAFGLKTPGALMAISGAILAANQPFMDQLWGRALLWIGVGLLFVSFFTERRQQFLQALLKRKQVRWPEVTEAIRSWELNPYQALKATRMKDRTLLNETILSYEKSIPLFEENLQKLSRQQPALVNTLKTLLLSQNGKPLATDSRALLQKLNQKLSQNGFSLILAAEVPDTASVLKQIRQSNKRLFGTENPAI